MNPSRELDCLIAEKVFGIEPELIPYAPRYSTDISAAWKVVEMLHRKYGYWFELTNSLKKETSYTVNFRCYFSKASPSHASIYNTAPHAICLAALNVVEGK